MLFFKHVFYKHHHGDLMAARVRLFTRTKSDILAQYNLPDQPYLLFFLGSRPSHFQAFSQLFLQMITLKYKIITLNRNKNTNTVFVSLFLHIIVSVAP